MARRKPSRTTASANRRWLRRLVRPRLRHNSKSLGKRSACQLPTAPHLPGASIARAKIRQAICDLLIKTTTQIFRQPNQLKSQNTVSGLTKKAEPPRSEEH